MNIKIHQPIAIHELGKRQNQEDAIYPAINKATTGDRLFLVCDGMGGHEKGEVASNLVCDVLSDFINNKNTVLTDELFKEALEQVYVQLDSKDDGAFKKMGTTMTLLYFHKEGCTLAHIGDSRIYHIRPASKQMLYKSRDHSLVYDLYRSGEISFEEMKTSPQKNVITRALMPGKDNRVRADITHVTDIEPGDYFYLCSDGMLEEMEDMELLQLLSADSSNEKKRSQLVAATVDNSDNHSAYLVQVSEVIREEGDQALQGNEADVPWNVADELTKMTDVEDAIDVSVVEVPEAPKGVENVAPPISPARKKRQRKNNSYLSYIVAALVVALFFFIFGTMKGCNRTAKTEEPNNWSVPEEQPQRGVMKPVRRQATSNTPQRGSNPKATVTSDQKSEKKKKEENSKNEKAAEPQEVEPSAVSSDKEGTPKETSANKVKNELDKRLEQRKAALKETSVATEKKERQEENNQNQEPTNP